MTMNELNEESPRADIPTACAVQPYPHQLADLHHMRRLEGSYLPGAQVTLDPERSLVTSVGFLCDPPGAGKTFAVLMHSLTSPPPTSTPFALKTCMEGCASVTTHAVGYVMELETDVIVVPRGTLRQWRDCLARMFAPGALPPHLIKSTLSQEETTAVLGGDYGLVITAESGARALCDHADYRLVRFRRIVLDEADSIRIPAFQMPRARFRWLVTATPHSFPRIVELRAFLSDLRLHRDVLDAVTVASTPDFVQSSLQLPPYAERTVQVRRSSLNTFLRTLVPEGVMTALEANDYRTAMGLLGLDSVSDEDNLVRAVIDKHKKEAEGLERLFATAPVSLLPSLEARIREARKAVKNIEERIRSADCCPIGLCDLTPECVRAVVPCCHNVFLFVNIMAALQRQPVCPLCKAKLDPRQLVVANPDTAGEDAAVPAPRPAPADPDQRTHATSIVAFEAVLKHIVAQNSKARVLVFSDYDMHEYERVLSDQGIRRGELKGNTAHIANTIARFEAGDVQALTVSVRHFGAGLNLHMADHIVVVHHLGQNRYTQLVGRSQRPGRNGPLTVWRLQYVDGQE